MLSQAKMTKKTSPQPRDTPWERLDRAFRTALRVPKAVLVKEEARQKRLRQKRRAKKPT